MFNKFLKILEECTHRPAPEYGSYVGSRRSWCPGQRAQYQCNRTFRLVGEEYSRCQRNGRWEHGVPTCRSESIIYQHRSI